MNAQTQNTPAQSPAKAFQVYMQKYKSQLEMALPKHLTVDRMMRLSLTAFSQNSALQQCSSSSIFFKHYYCFATWFRAGCEWPRLFSSL